MSEPGGLRMVSRDWTVPVKCDGGGVEAASDWAWRELMVSCAGSEQRMVQERRQRPDNDPGGEREHSEVIF